MPAEIFNFFISELRAKVQDGCKDLAQIMAEYSQFGSRFLMEMKKSVKGSPNRWGGEGVG